MSKELRSKGRIINKHDTETGWLKSVYKNGEVREDNYVDNPFIPLFGELIVYDPDLLLPEDHPGRTQTRIKFGDGVTNVVALPFSYHSNVMSLQIKGDKIIYYTADGEQHVLYDREANDYFLATDERAGITLLYKEIGDNENGTMTQKAIRDELDKKASVSIQGQVLHITQNILI